MVVIIMDFFYIYFFWGGGVVGVICGVIHRLIRRIQICGYKSFMDV